MNVVQQPVVLAFKLIVILYCNLGESVPLLKKLLKKEALIF